MHLGAGADTGILESKRADDATAVPASRTSFSASALSTSRAVPFALSCLWRYLAREIALLQRILAALVSDGFCATMGNTCLDVHSNPADA